MPVLKYRPDESSSWQTVGITADGYTKEETDALLQNKAPAGYGLGGNAKSLTSADDLNFIWKSGYYSWHSSNIPKNMPDIKGLIADVFIMHVCGSGENAYCQEIIPITNGEAYTCANNNKLVRSRYGNIIKGWDWVNPPMRLGTEYRTVERYLGKPVYVMLLDCGLLVQGTLTYPHGISDIDVCVRYSGVASTSTGVFSGKGALPSFTTPSALNSQWNIFIQNFGTTNIDIYNGGGLTGCPVYVTVWYTKTTD